MCLLETTFIILSVGLFLATLAVRASTCQYRRCGETESGYQQKFTCL